MRNRLPNERVQKLIVIHRYFGIHADKDTGILRRFEGKGMDLEDLIEEGEVTLADENLTNQVQVWLLFSKNLVIIR